MASMFDRPRFEKIPPRSVGIEGTSKRGDDVPAVEVLLVGTTHTENAFTKAFENSNWKLELAFSPSEAAERLRESPKGVVICEESQAGFTLRDRLDQIGSAEEPVEAWAELLSSTRKLANPPKVIVASRAADDRLWADVLHLGGYDVLPLPLEAPEAIRMVSMAWLEWRHEREADAAIPQVRAATAR